jgi:hypothetical protein
MNARHYKFKRINYSEYEYTHNNKNCMYIQSREKGMWHIYIKTKCYVLQSNELWTNMKDAKCACILWFEALGGNLE